MRLVRSPVVQFLAAVLLALAVAVIGTGTLSRRAAADEATSDARVLTRVLAGSVAEPALPATLTGEDPSAPLVFDEVARERLLVEDVRRLKIWSADGEVLYSDRPELIGSHYELGPDEREVLEEGGIEAELSDLDRPENRFERGIEGGLLEVYTRIRSPRGEPLLFEAYYSVADLEEQRETVLARFRPVTLGALLFLVAIATPLLVLLTRRLTRAGDERERLLQSAVRASDAERLRIARDLHDGVVQDLAGSSYALSTAAGRGGVPPGVASELESVSCSLRTSMRALRSLLVEIYPPDLQTGGLAPALGDLLAPLESAGVRTTLEVSDEADASPEAVALVWRVAQEAVRNAARHAGAREVHVVVAREVDGLVLLVRDDGSGFDPSRATQGTRFGLRGLDSLVTEAGGTLTVASRPGEGTTVRVEVPTP